jgi:hypothetical protein
VGGAAENTVKGLNDEGVRLIAKAHTQSLYSESGIESVPAVGCLPCGSDRCAGGRDVCAAALPHLVYIRRESCPGAYLHSLVRGGTHSRHDFDMAVTLERIEYRRFMRQRNHRVTKPMSGDA